MLKQTGNNILICISMKSIKVQEPWQRAIVILQYRFIVHTSGNARTSEENTLDCQRS